MVLSTKCVIRMMKYVIMFSIFKKYHSLGTAGMTIKVCIDKNKKELPIQHDKKNSH